MALHIDITSNMIAMLLHAKHSMAIAEWDDKGIWFGGEQRVPGMGENKCYLAWGRAKGTIDIASVYERVPGMGESTP